MNQQTENPQTLESHGVRVTQTMTTPSKPGKKPRPVWVVSGNVFGLEDFFYELGGKKYRGNWSFFRNPADDILRELNENGRKSYADQVEGRIERKEARIERFEQYSENATDRAHSAFKKIDSIMSFIPPGQPILVGHHSERRHRRDIARMDSGIRKGVEETKKAEHYTWRAHSLGHDINRMKESRQYVSNQIDKAEKEVRRLEKHKSYSSDPVYHEKLGVLIAQKQEAVTYWQQRMSEMNAEIVAEGGEVATPESVKVGGHVCYRGTWYPVVRVNKKTVTIGNWLGVAKFTWKADYAGISKFRNPEEN